MCGGGGNPISNAVKGVQKAVKGATGALQGAVGNVAQGAQGVVRGAQQVGSGDLRGLQTMGGAVVNTGSGLVGNSADLTRAGIDAAFSTPRGQLLQGTPLDGMIRGNLKGAVGSAEGLIRGNVAGIQDLPTDIGKGAQHVLDQAGNIVGEIGKGLGGLLGGGGGGGGSAGGITAPQYYKDLAQKQAEYGMNLPDEFQKYEGERFAPPSDRTTAAETAIYNNNANSQQAAFDRAGQLMNQGNQYTSTDPTAASYQGVTTQGPQSFSGSSYGNANTGGIFSPQSFGNANTGSANPNANLTANTYQNQNRLVRGADYGNANQGMTSQTFKNVSEGLKGTEFQNANAGFSNVNANLSNPLKSIEPTKFDSANSSLSGPVKYDRNYQSLIDQSFNPYQDSVISQTMSDLDRARKMTLNDIGGQAAKAGAFGGSRQALLEAENNRNFYSRAAAAAGQLRSQGFESAANRAQQESLQRLGLSASDVQNVRGLQSQGNLQAQQLTASDRASARDLAGRGALQTQQLQSQGGLQAQNLQAQGAQAAQRLSAQDAQQARALQAQGAQAAQNLSASDAQNVRGLSSQGALQGQRLTADSASQAAALQSQGALQSQNLTASDAQNVRGLQSQGALQTQNLLSQGALQGQNLTAGDLRDLRGALSSANLQGQRLTADSQNLATQLGAQSFNQAADRELQALLNAQNLGATSVENQQRNALTNAYNQAQFGQAANNSALNAAQLQGQLGGQMDDRTRQQMYDQLQMGQNQDVRNQAQADFDYQQFVDETQRFPAQYLANLNNAGSLGSRLIYTQQPTSGGGGQRGGLSGILGGALSGAAVGGPMGALIGGGLGALGAGVPQNMSGLSQFSGLFDSPAAQPMLYNPNQMNQMGY